MAPDGAAGVDAQKDKVAETVARVEHFVGLAPQTAVALLSKAPARGRLNRNHAAAPVGVAPMTRERRQGLTRERRQGSPRFITAGPDGTPRAASRELVMHHDAILKPADAPRACASADPPGEALKRPT